MGYFKFLEEIKKGSSFTLDSLEQQDLQERIVGFLRIGGQFPVSKELKTKLKINLEKPGSSIDQIPLHLCNELFIPLRFIALANQALYSRGKPVVDLAVIGSLFGITSTAEKLSELAKEQPIGDFYKGRATALVAYQGALLKAQLSQKLYSLLSKQKFPSTQSFMVSSLVDSLPVALAYLRPDLYAHCWIASEISENLSFDKALKQIFAGTIQERYRNMISELGLPKVMFDYTTLLDVSPWNRKSWPVASSEENKNLALATFVGSKVAHGINLFLDKQDFYALLRSFDGKGRLTKKILDEMLLDITSIYHEILKSLSVPTMRLPDHLKIYENRVVSQDGKVEDLNIEWSPVSKRFNSFIFELKACFQSFIGSTDSTSRLTQAVFCTAQSLMRGLNFDRVVFFDIEQADAGILALPRLISGSKVEDQSLLIRNITNLADHCPDRTAFYEKRAIFQGDPIVGDDWPFVSFPVVRGGKVVGIIYADKQKSKEEVPLTMEEQVSCLALAEVWQKAPESLF